MSDINFHIEGTHADSTAKALETFFSENFDHRPRRNLLPQHSAGETEKPIQWRSPH